MHTKMRMNFHAGSPPQIIINLCKNVENLRLEKWEAERNPNCWICASCPRLHLGMGESFDLGFLLFSASSSPPFCIGLQILFWSPRENSPSFLCEFLVLRRDTSAGKLPEQNKSSFLPISTPLWAQFPLTYPFLGTSSGHRTAPRNLERRTNFRGDSWGSSLRMILEKAD